MNLQEMRLALAQSFVVGLSGPRAELHELDLISREGLGGAILFGRNIDSPKQVWQLNTSLARAAGNSNRPPLFIMVDQEGGSVARLKSPFTHGPDFCELGQTGREEALWAHGRQMARELKAAGFNWDLAPVLDVHALPDGVMIRRSLGADPELVSRLGAAFIRGMQEAGLLACAKHFPGLGRTTLDTHKDRPRVDLSRAELDRLELPPFRGAVDARVAGIMICHAVFSALDEDNPSSLSTSVIQGLLRGELGYQGLVLSDDLEMGAVAAHLSPDKAAVRAYQAGCDLLLICDHPEYALQALEELTELGQKGELPLKRIRQSHARILKTKESLQLLPGPLDTLTTLLEKSA